MIAPNAVHININTNEENRNNRINEKYTSYKKTLIYCALLDIITVAITIILFSLYVHLEADNYFLLVLSVITLLTITHRITDILHLRKNYKIALANDTSEDNRFIPVVKYASTLLCVIWKFIISMNLLDLPVSTLGIWIFVQILIFYFTAIIALLLLRDINNNKILITTILNINSFHFHENPTFVQQEQIHYRYIPNNIVSCAVLDDEQISRLQSTTCFR